MSSIPPTQKVFVITVSSNQFSPSNITAGDGDIVQFQFMNGNHSVTQADISAQPCQKPARGVDSGFIPVDSTATQIPSWSFTVTDNTKPLIFYCGQTVPTSHCAAGMVIGVNAGTVFDQYRAAALALSDSTSSSAVTASTPTSPSSLQKTSTSVQNGSPTSSTKAKVDGQSTRFPIGAVVGVVVGGCILFAIIVSLLLWRRSRRRRLKVDLNRADDSSPMNALNMDSTPFLPPNNTTSQRPSNLVQSSSSLRNPDLITEDYSNPKRPVVLSYQPPLPPLLQSQPSESVTGSSSSTSVARDREIIALQNQIDALQNVVAGYQADRVDPPPSYDKVR